MPASVTPLTPQGRLIRGARKASGMSIPQAAAKAGISVKHWGNIERGHTAGTPGMLAVIARSLSITPDALEKAAGKDAADALIDMPDGTPQPPPAGDDEADMIAAVTAAIMSQAHKPLEQRERELRKALAAMGTAPGKQRALKVTPERVTHPQRNEADTNTGIP